MRIEYSRTIEQLQAFKPAYDKGLKRLRELQVPAGMPMADFFGELRDTALQGAEFGDLLQSDPALEKISLEELARLNAKYYAPLDPESGYASCFGNPDYAVKLYGEELGQLCACLLYTSPSPRDS